MVSDDPSCKTPYYELFRRCYDPVLKKRDKKSKSRTVLTGLYSSYAPSFICGTCYARMQRYDTQQSDSLIIEEPPVWNKMNDDHSDCFFCLYEVSRHGRPPTTSSIKKPVFATNETKGAQKRSATEAGLDETTVQSPSKSNNSKSSASLRGSDESFNVSSYLSEKKKAFILYNQKSLNNLVRRLRLSKMDAEELAADLKSRNLLEKGCFVSFFRERGKILDEFFEEDEDGVYMFDIEGLFRKCFQQELVVEDWRLFIDSSMRSIKAVLLHNGDLPEIPVFYSQTLKESYETMKIILNSINYKKYEFNVCGDLKVLNLIRGIKSGNVSYPCLKCLWDSRAYSTHYKEKNIAPRDDKNRRKQKKKKSDRNEEYSEILPPLVNPGKLMLPPLHVKLGLFSQLIKSIFRKKDDEQIGDPEMNLMNELEEDRELFEHLYTICDDDLNSPPSQTTAADEILKDKLFANLSEQYKRLIVFLKKTFPYKTPAKIKQGIFNGPEIRRLIKNRKEFEKTQPSSFKDAWCSFVCVVENFLGNNRSRTYKSDCKQLVKNFELQGCLMSVKLHYIDKHVDDFPSDCGKLGEEKGERFHKDIESCERRFLQKYNKQMIMDYVWFLVNEKEDVEVKKRKPKRRSFQHKY